MRFPRIVAERYADRPDYPHPTMSDLSVTGLALLVLMPLRVVTTRNLFAPLGDKLLPTCKERPAWTEELRNER